MSQIGLNQSSLLSTSSSDIGQVPKIQPRLCILRKWSHYDGTKNHSFLLEIQ